MDSGTSKTLTLAALGRPFGLGMLYDCRQDCLIPGVTLWSRDNLEHNVRERPKNNNEFEILASESIADKSSALNVEASLKAGFFSGLVEVEGSAKYLHNNKTSTNQARVTLKYEATTKFQELSMEHLGRGNLDFPYVFEQGTATHVVTGILYGAQAFLVFDQDVSDGKTEQDIEGSLRVMINKIPSLKIEGSGSVKLSAEDVETVKKFKCKFHGDFLLKQTPTTFEEAVEVYQSLPALLGTSGEKAVPMKAWLLPLATLDSTAAKLVREISAAFVEDAQKVLEDFGEVEVRCNDALKTKAQQFSQVSKKIKHFREMCSQYTVEFQRNLATVLPSIRGGGEEESALAEILEKRMSSPFRDTYLNEWLDGKEREVDTITFFSSLFKNTQTVPSQINLYKEVLGVEHAMCFVFTSLGSDEPYLSALSNYLKDPTDADGSAVTNAQDLEKQKWYNSKEVLTEMRTKAKLFRDFAEANKENRNIRFLTVGLTDDKHKGSTIYLYQDGFPVSENFEPPSKPETVTAAGVTHDSVTLTVSPPRFGAENVTSYSLEFQVSGQKEWKQETVPKADEVTVKGLKPNTEYVFGCRAVTSAGVGPVSDLRDPRKTLPCSPPGEVRVQTDVCELLVSWEKPAEVGQDVEIQGYTLEYATNDPGVAEEDLKWSQIQSDTLTGLISALPPNTDYTVRVTCDCGGAGRSKASLPVSCRTPDTHLLLLREILDDFTDLEAWFHRQLQNPAVQQLRQIAEVLKMFNALCMEFKQLTLQELMKVPSVLGSQEKEAVIREMKTKRNSGPFNQSDLRSWTGWWENRIGTVQSLISMMENTELIPSPYVFGKKIHSAEHVVTFVFTSLGLPDMFLSALGGWLDQKHRLWIPLPHPFEHKGDVLLRERAKLFREFAEANKENSKIKFLTVGLTDDKHRDSTICLHKDGFLVTDDFQPPSEPVLTVKAGSGSATLTIGPPASGAENVTSYSVEHSIRGEDRWERKDVQAGEVTVGNLRPNTVHLFRCRAVTSVGVGPAKEIFALIN